jgi:ABC-type transport system involved in cytochrome bd biosynthesis fused ATPase/permease subunit
VGFHTVVPTQTAPSQDSGPLLSVGAIVGIVVVAVVVLMVALVLVVLVVVITLKHNANKQIRYMTKKLRLYRYVCSIVLYPLFVRGISL